MFAYKCLFPTFRFIYCIKYDILYKCPQKYYLRHAGHYFLRTYEHFFPCISIAEMDKVSLTDYTAFGKVVFMIIIITPKKSTTIKTMHFPESCFFFFLFFIIFEAKLLLSGVFCRLLNAVPTCEELQYELNYT